MARRKALALPILNGAVVIHFHPSLRQIERARIALGPVGEKPFRARKTETYLESREVTSEVLEEAGHIASEEANPRTSSRGSAFYRKEMVRVNLMRTIEKILDEMRRGR